MKSSRIAALVALIAAAAALALGMRGARADWLQPDASYREAQLILRMAARDTAGHQEDPARLDSLGVALLHLARLPEAEALFRRSLAVHPGDDAAEAALGKLALFNDRLGEAESLLTAAGADPDAQNDLFATRIRLGEYHSAAELAPQINQDGFVALLERMAEHPPYQITAGPEQATVFWTRTYPVPLVRVKLNGESVLMALDTGASELLLDESSSKRCKVERLAGQRIEFWSGSRFAVQNAMVQRLEIGGFKVEQVPAGTMKLRRWSMEVNPQSEQVAGIIGLGFMRRFNVTLDYDKQRLELRRPGVPFTPGANAARVPFQIWGQSELTVFGSLAGGRKMALVVQTGVPGCGIGAPEEVFDEIGVKPSKISKLVKGAGSWLQGRPWTPVTVPTVALGRVVKDKVPGLSGVLDSSELWRHGVRRDAILSSDFFRGRRVTFDWTAQELVFEE